MILEICKNAKLASKDIAKLTSAEKNTLLQSIHDSIDKNRHSILKENARDMENGRKSGLNEGLLDRLLLTDERIDGILLSIRQIMALKDPIGEVLHMDRLENNLLIGKQRVPMGVIGIIYESRPNVTVDCTALCLKTSNALILRGGKEAIHSNISLANAIREGIRNAGFNENIVQIIEDTSYETANDFMAMKGYVDLLIPRGSARLIQAVINNAKVPVLETGTGNCHVYVDGESDIKMALSIIENAKTQRIGVCNAMESLVVNESVSKSFYEGLEKIIKDYEIDVYGCEKSREKLSIIQEATKEDFYTEYLDYKFSMKVVADVFEAIDWINEHSTGHSEVIVTNNYQSAKAFTEQVDSACVYVNASSRFTDGFEFGMGAEMGISTQKLHARGPVGLKELTSTKYIILGEGQIRP